MYLVILKDNFLKKLTVRDFENNIINKEAGIQLIVTVTQLFQKFILKMPHNFQIFVNIVIWKFLCIQ